MALPQHLFTDDKPSVQVNIIDDSMGKQIKQLVNKQIMTLKQAQYKFDDKGFAQQNNAQIVTILLLARHEIICQKLHKRMRKMPAIQNKLSSLETSTSTNLGSSVNETLYTDQHGHDH